MDEHLAFVETKRLERVKAALEKNNMSAQIAQTAAEVPAMVRQLLPEGCTVTNGGSMTLNECGVRELLLSGSYDFLDRDAPGADHDAIFHAAFSADWYLASANAVTENGEIYQMDGRANRVAALAYGPDHVLMVIGRNKVVADLDAARERNRRVSGPANNHRLSCKTPCAVTGICADCKGEARICCSELVMHRQRIDGRVHVILVNEELGY